MLSRLPFTYKGDLLQNGYSLPRWDMDIYPIKFEAFSPSPKLVDDINKSLRTSYPLLITGEINLRDLVGQSVCVELNNQGYMNNHFLWKVKRGQKFNDSIYHYRHADKKRDLEYYQMHPEGNPVKEAEHYFSPGHVLRMMELPLNFQECPVLEIRDVHLADQDFVIELMDFLLNEEGVFVPELDKRYDKKDDTFPLVILTAEEGYIPPENHLGIIYKHNLEFPERDELLRRMLIKYERYIDPVKIKTFENHQFEAVWPLIEKTVDLFLIAKDNDLLRPGQSPFPMTLPELSDAIEEKVIQVCKDWDSLKSMIKQLDETLAAQQKIGELKNMEEAKRMIKEYVEKDRLNSAIKSLKLIQKGLSKSLQNEISQLISIHHDLAQKERMGTESELILYPMRNKLNFDILNLVDRF